MNENELKLLWQSSNKKIEESLTINKNNSEDITRLKVQNFLSTMKPVKIFTLAIGILWIIMAGAVLANLFVNAYDKISLFFLYSAGIQVLITAIAVGIYIHQLDLIYNTDFSDSVIVIQQKLSKLKLSTLTVTRILFLQLPVWTTFYWNEALFENGNVSLWVIQIIITLMFTYLSLWLFFNIKYKNRNKRWFKLIFSGREWQPILQAMELIRRIENYKDPRRENGSH
jgi:hypothetical protein